MDPTSISPADAATMLTEENLGTITEAMIRKDIADGAPVNDDGTLNLVFYAAWLVREKQRGDRPA